MHFLNNCILNRIRWSTVPSLEDILILELDSKNTLKPFLSHESANAPFMIPTAKKVYVCLRLSMEGKIGSVQTHGKNEEERAHGTQREQSQKAQNHPSPKEKSKEYFPITSTNSGFVTVGDFVRQVHPYLLGNRTWLLSMEKAHFHEDLPEGTQYYYYPGQEELEVQIEEETGETYVFLDIHLFRENAARYGGKTLEEFSAELLGHGVSRRAPLNGVRSEAKMETEAQRDQKKRVWRGKGQARVVVGEEDVEVEIDENEQGSLAEWLEKNEVIAEATEDLEDDEEMTMES